MSGDRTAVNIHRAVAAGFVDPSLYDPHNPDWDLHLQLGMLEVHRQTAFQVSLVNLIASVGALIRSPAEDLKTMGEAVQGARNDALVALMPWLRDKILDEFSPQAAGDAYAAAYGKPGDPQYEAAKRENFRIQRAIDNMTKEQYHAFLDEDLRRQREASARRRMEEQRAAYIASQQNQGG